MQRDEEIRSVLERTPPGLPVMAGDLDAVRRRARVRRIRRGTMTPALAAVLVAGILLPLLVLGPLRDVPEPAPPAFPPQVIVLDRIAVPSGAAAVAVGEGGVWVAGFDWVSRIDPSTAEVVATIRTPRTGDFSDMAVGAAAVWVTSGNGWLYRIDPATDAVAARIDVGGAPQGVAVGGGAVWVTRAAEGRGDVVRVDPETNAVSGEPIRLGIGPGPIVYEADALWVANTGLTVGVVRGPIRFQGPSIMRVDAATGDVEELDEIAGFPQAVGAESVWGLAQGELLSPGTSGADAVFRLDPRRREVTATVAVTRAQEVGFGEGLVWVATTPPSSDPELFEPDRAHPGTVVLIDPSTDAIVGDPMPVRGLQPIDLATGEGGAWLADYTDGTVTRLGVRRD